MAKQLEQPKIEIEIARNWQDYVLLDSGNGKTLERFGPYTLIRPEPQVIWKPTLPGKEWAKANARMQEEQKEYGGHWTSEEGMAKTWVIRYGSLKFQVQLGTSRHIGVFPEQASHWDWISEQISGSAKPPKVLNLFGYTGLATLAAAAAGAEVTHVDSSKHALTWANHNLTLSGLGDKAVRWIAEDAVKFVQREAKRGNRYDGLILDPPKFGRGSEGKVWDFYKNLPELVSACHDVLSDHACFVVLTAYAIQASALITYQAMQEMVVDHKGRITCGELATVEESGGHLLSHALFVRWTSRI